MVDLDLAPELDGILKPNSKLWKPLMDGFIQSLYPPGTPSRIPIIAVTGTNGTSSTSRMIDGIMRQAGFDSALSCSEGLYVAGQRVKSNQSPKRLREMHHRLIRNRKVELAVMEFRLDQLKNGGFPFDWCNVGVVTDVTADQLQSSWETVREVAEIQFSVPQRARDGVVLNADDPHTPDMLQRLDAGKIVLTSTHQMASEIRSGNVPVSALVTIEHLQGGDRIVISQEDSQLDLMGVTAIPATLGEATGLTLDNALRAIAAGHLMKVPHSVIRAAMSSLE